MTLAEAEAIFAQPKRAAAASRSRRSPTSGAHPESGAPVRVLDGRFGPYITDGTVNASVPRGVDPESVTVEQAVELLRERRARRGAGEAGRRSATAKKAAAKKTTAKKTAPAKKATARKATAKKAARHQEGDDIRPLRYVRRG